MDLPTSSSIQLSFSTTCTHTYLYTYNSIYEVGVFFSNYDSTSKFSTYAVSDKEHPV